MHWAETDEPWIDPHDDFCEGCGHSPTHSRSWIEKGDPRVHIIAFWPIEERGLMGYDNRWISRCHLRTACAQSHYSLQIIEEPHQAYLPKGLPVIGVEEPHEIEDTERDGIETSLYPPPDIRELFSFVHPRDAVYIVGNTYYQRPSDHFNTDISLGITMNDNDLANYSPYYGDQLIPIIWYDRTIKGNNYA